MLNDYALIIGVESYRAFDPSGHSDVPGALNDARALLRECLAMGFSPERIRVLTSPVLSAAAAGPGTEGIHFGEATRDQMVAGLTWIYGELSHPEPSAGLCTFSGHGLMSPDLVLCPADFDGNAGSLVPVAEVRSKLGDGKVAHNLTVLLDCCHAQGSASAARNVTARLAALAPGLGGGGEIPERLLAACRTDQTSVSSRFSGVMQGAFTWAATATMGQWKATKEDGVARLDVSYGELRDRTRGLLSALSFDQVPVLSGPPGVAKLPFLHPGRRGAAGETTKDPNAVRPRRQIGTGAPIIQINYSVQARNQISTVIAPFGNVYATDDAPIYIAGMPASPQTEYWYLDASKVAQLQYATSLYFGSRDLQSGANYVLPTFVEASGIVYAEEPGWANTIGWNRADAGQSSYIFYSAEQYAYLQLIIGSGNQIAKIYWYLPQSQESIEPSALYELIARQNVYPAFPTGNWHVNTNAPNMDPTTNSPILAPYVIKWPGTLGSTHPTPPASNFGLTLAPLPGAPTVTAVVLATSASACTKWLMSPVTQRIHLASNPSLVIDVNVSGPRQLTSGLALILNHVDYDRPSQEWTWTTGSGSYQTFKNGDTDSQGNSYYMDNNGGSTQLDNKVQVWRQQGSSSTYYNDQQWGLVSTT